MKFKDLSYVLLLRTVLFYAREHRNRYLIALSFLLFSQLFYLAQPYLMGQFINRLQDGLSDQNNFTKAILFLCFYFLCSPISWLFHGPARIKERQVAFFVRRNFADSCYHKLKSMPYLWHQNFHTGQLYDRVRKAEEALEQFTSHQFRLIDIFVNTIIPVIVLFFLFKNLAFVCIAVVIVCIVIINRFDKDLIPTYTIRNNLSHKYSGTFSDYLANIRTIIALRLGSKTQSELMDRYNEKQPNEWKEYRLNEWKWFTIEFLSEFIVVASIILYLFVIRDQPTIQIGTIVMLFQYMFKFSTSFWRFGRVYQDVIENAANYRSIQIIDTDYQNYVEKGLIDDDNKQQAIEWKNITIEDLNFSYEDNASRPQALLDINISIRSNEKIAFVGESGSGKSTLMTVLRGLYHAEKGSVTLDGKVYSNLSLLQKITTLIPQDPEIFENTIRYNITFGMQHSDQDIMDACHLAGFDTVLDELPKGLESDIREKGVNLSGGQKQRLALARGIFAIQYSSLILMDEPTSSVDTLTEMYIFERLFNRFADKAVIASVHRLHLLSRFDTIYFLDKGRIIEKGSFNDLLAQNGRFAALWSEYQELQKQDESLSN